ncbi:MAG: hypothetical protein AB1746_11205 [Candidatus Zixiibacteriota bacterium]
MNRKLYYLSALVLILAICWVISCATFGSYAKVKAPEKMKLVKCIALTEPVLNQKLGRTISKATDETWYNLVNTRFLYALAENGMLDYICDDDLKDVISRATRDKADLEKYHMAMARPGQNTDAVLKTEMEIRLKEDNKGDTYVIMQLLDAKTEDVIIDVKFNTMWGVGYVNKPTTLMTIRDGISGAVEQLANQMKK